MISTHKMRRHGAEKSLLLLCFLFGETSFKNEIYLFIRMLQDRIALQNEMLILCKHIQFSNYFMLFKEVYFSGFVSVLY